MASGDSLKIREILLLCTSNRLIFAVPLLKHIGVVSRVRPNRVGRSGQHVGRSSGKRCSWGLDGGDLFWCAQWPRRRCRPRPPPGKGRGRPMTWSAALHDVQMVLDDDHTWLALAAQFKQDVHEFSACTCNERPVVGSSRMSARRCADWSDDASSLVQLHTLSFAARAGSWRGWPPRRI